MVAYVTFCHFLLWAHGSKWTVIQHLMPLMVQHNGGPWHKSHKMNGQCTSGIGYVQMMLRMWHFLRPHHKKFLIFSSILVNVDIFAPFNGHKIQSISGMHPYAIVNKKYGNYLCWKKRFLKTIDICHIRNTIFFLSKHVYLFSWLIECNSHLEKNTIGYIKVKSIKI